MPDQLMGDGPGDAGDGRRCLLEHRQVADLQDVVEVAGIGCGCRDRLGPGLVGPGGEFGERLPAVGVRLPLDVVRR